MFIQVERSLFLCGPHRTAHILGQCLNLVRIRRINVHMEKRMNDSRACDNEVPELYLTGCTYLYILNCVFVFVSVFVSAFIIKRQSYRPKTHSIFVGMLKNVFILKIKNVRMKQVNIFDAVSLLCIEIFDLIDDRMGHYLFQRFRFDRNLISATDLLTNT